MFTSNLNSRYKIQYFEELNKLNFILAGPTQENRQESILKIAEALVDSSITISDIELYLKEDYVFCKVDKIGFEDIVGSIPTDIKNNESYKDLELEYKNQDRKIQLQHDEILLNQWGGLTALYKVNLDTLFLSISKEEQLDMFGNPVTYEKTPKKKSAPVKKTNLKPQIAMKAATLGYQDDYKFKLFLYAHKLAAKILKGTKLND